MQLIYYSDTLTHHGIKGQKWGIRRYQPYPKGHKSGKEIGEALRIASTISEGRKMSPSKGDSSKKKKTSMFEKTVKQGKDKPTISPAEKIANDANKATQEAVSAASKIINAAESKKLKNNRAEGLNDEELRKRINRLRMERDYNSLTSEETSSGYDKAMTALSVIGAVASIAATTTGIVATVKSARK